jgi:RNA polymerase-binding transcription factor DksA
MASPCRRDAVAREGTSARLRELLLVERARVGSQLASLGRDFDVIVAASDSVATDDEHDPEGATIAFERAQVTALRAQAASHLADIDRALGKVDDGSYGVCERCSRAIGADRLEARPAALLCVTCAAAESRNRGSG